MDVSESASTDAMDMLRSGIMEAVLGPDVVFSGVQARTRFLQMKLEAESRQSGQEKVK